MSGRVGRVLICGPERGTDDARPVHACYKTLGLPADWEAPNGGRWMHVDHGDAFAGAVEQITCRACLAYVASDREAAS